MNLERTPWWHLSRAEAWDILWRECWRREHGGDEAPAPDRPDWWRPGLLTERAE